MVSNEIKDKNGADGISVIEDAETNDLLII